MQFDGVCNTYEVYSCNVNVPLWTSEMVLITVQGHPDDSDKINMRSLSPALLESG